MAHSQEARLKAAERAQKLLRLAAPESQSTVHERTNAALEAAKVIGDYDLVVIVPEPKKKLRRPASNPARTWKKWVQYVPPITSNWQYSIADKPQECSQCHQIIYPGEESWFDTERGYIHYDITCDDAQ